jgi:hypothetical protein
MEDAVAIVIPVAPGDEVLIPFCVKSIRRSFAGPVVIGIMSDPTELNYPGVTFVKWSSNPFWSLQQVILYQTAFDLFPSVEKVARLDVDCLLKSDYWSEMPENVVAKTYWVGNMAHGSGIGSVLRREAVSTLLANSRYLRGVVESRHIWNNLKALFHENISLEPKEGIVHLYGFHPSLVELIDAPISKIIHLGSIGLPSRPLILEYMQKNLEIFETWCNKKV